MLLRCDDTEALLALDAALPPLLLESRCRENSPPLCFESDAVDVRFDLTGAGCAGVALLCLLLNSGIVVVDRGGSWF